MATVVYIYSPINYSIFSNMPLKQDYNKLHLTKTVTCLSVLSMSIPWPQGAAGFARQSPAFPLLEISIFCLLRLRNVSAITRTPS